MDPLSSVRYVRMAISSHGRTTFDGMFVIQVYVVNVDKVRYRRDQTYAHYINIVRVHVCVSAWKLFPPSKKCRINFSSIISYKNIKFNNKILIFNISSITFSTNFFTKLAIFNRLKCFHKIYYCVFLQFSLLDSMFIIQNFLAFTK